MRHLPAALIGAALTAYAGVAQAAADFSYQNMFVVAMKLSPAYDYEAGVDGYMQVFRQTVWQSSHNDEFELQAKKKDTIELMKKVVSGTPADEQIVIHTNFEFGDYDFKEHKFPFSPLSENSQFQTNPVYTQNNAAPNLFTVSFSNTDFINGIPMPEDAAHAFVTRHKSFGNVNRTLQTDITFVPKSLKSENSILGEIVKVVVRDPSSKGQVVMTLPASH